MTVLYPRKRVEAVLRPLHLSSATRIFLRKFASDPLGTAPGPSRFCDGHSFAVLYAAEAFETAFVEVVVRDRFVHRDERVIQFDEIRSRAWVQVSLVGRNTLQLVDLREDGCLKLGAPTDTVHARNHAAGRALAQSLYEQHPDVDGICFSSRLTSGNSFAIFDRATERLRAKGSGLLEDHPDLPDVLRNHGISIQP